MKLGLTQQELAQKLNITDKVVSNWETGRSLPDTSMILPLADALNISFEELFNGINSTSTLRGIENNNLKVKYKNLNIFPSLFSNMLNYNNIFYNAI